MQPESWDIKVETVDGRKKTFRALACYELTEEDKLKWMKSVGQFEQITRTKITYLAEMPADHPLGKMV